MKYTIKNPLNSPYNVAGEEGQVHIPARGEVTAPFTDMQIHAIRATGYFTVTEAGKKRDPLDHDGDGVRGGFNTSPEPVNETAEGEHIAKSAVETETAPDVPLAPRRGRPRKNKE